MDEQAGLASRALMRDTPQADAPDDSADDLGPTFRQLADIWRDETGALSSPSQIATHPAYQRIIDMGDRVLPYIFEDLQERGGQWYVALRAITGASPVPPEASGRARQVREAWLQWGRDHRYIR